MRYLVKSAQSVLALFVIFWVLPDTATATSAPALITPGNNSTLSSGPKLEWQLVEGSVQYRVIVDDEPTLSIPYIKNYYTVNNYYSPVLNDGTYYWKVSAKDNLIWSLWSDVWSFTLSSVTPAPSITPNPTLTPDPSPVSSSDILPSSSFTLSNYPSNIDSDQPFTVTVDLSLPKNPNSQLYLKGAFKKSGSANYFGLTKTGQSWVKNGDSYLQQLLITTDSTGNWSGQIEVKPDTEDSGYQGSGDYIFKIGRYTDSGIGPTWSNEVIIKINNIAGSSTSKPSSSVMVHTVTSPAIQNYYPLNPSKPSKSSFSYSVASVATAENIVKNSDNNLSLVKGESNSAPENQIISLSVKTLTPVIIGTVLVITGLGLFLKYRLERHTEVD